MDGISILLTAIQRYSTSENTLTAIHSDLIQVGETLLITPTGLNMLLSR